MDETLRVMQLLRDNYRLWEIDIKGIKDKFREGGHYQEDDNEEEELVVEDEAQVGVAQKKKEKLQDSLFGEAD